MSPLRRQRLQRAQSSITTGRDSGFESATPSNARGPQGQFSASTETTTQSNGIPPESVSAATSSSFRPQRLTLADLEATRTIGVGGWGAVHVARVRRTSSSHPLEQPGASLALKVIGKHILRDLERNDTSPDRITAAERKNAEKRILSSLPWNSFITGLVDAHVDTRNVYLAMELAHCGTLLTQLRKLPGLSDPEVKFYFANLVLALEFLHTQGIVHSDVKPENLVLGADGYLMLTDFGLAQPLHGATKWTRMGTLEYMSPEIISCEPMDTETKRLAADWWAAAIVLFEMKTREHPFECDNADELIEKHTNAPLRWPPKAYISEEFEDLVSRMLHVDLDHRYGARDVRAGKGGAFINKDVRTHPYMKCINWDRIAMRVAVAPRVPKSVPDLSNQAHRRPFLDPTKVPGLPVKRPSPRFEHLELTLEKEDSPRKKRRMAGQLSVCLRPSKRSKTALQGSVDGVD